MNETNANTDLVRAAPEGALGEQIEALAQAVAGGADREQCRSRASLSRGRRAMAPMAAAPAYSKAAAVNAPMSVPNCWTRGVLMPNSVAATKASRAPRRAGR